jgi:hypothetical protein
MIQLRSSVISWKTVRSGYISTERDGYFANRKLHPSVMATFVALARRKLRSRVTAGAGYA